MNITNDQPNTSNPGIWIKSIIPACPTDVQDIMFSKSSVFEIPADVADLGVDDE